MLQRTDEEQVDAGGYSWRSGARVERNMLKQWFLRITDFKQALLDDLKNLEEKNAWPERVIAMQRHWLGRLAGAKIQFALKRNGTDLRAGEHLTVFTTRPDTIHGVQYIAISAAHPLVARMRETDSGLNAFVNDLSSLGPESKEGFQLNGVVAENPLNTLSDAPASVRQPLPIFVAPYVLEKYGEGAVMGVPGHDVRDFAFWKQNNPAGPMRSVIQSSPAITASGSTSASEAAFEGRGFLNKECGRYAGLSSHGAAERIVRDLDPVAKPTETWRLRDWLISRQRYWGTPIPIIHCPSCGAVAVPASKLPVILPPLPSSTSQGAPSPLAAVHDWVNTTCPSCNGPAKRDTDTMDTFMCSSWYMFRFADPHNADLPFSPEAAAAALPVDVYVGGVEHAILHLLYARFISKFLATTDLWRAGADQNIHGEPFRQLLSQGMVHGRTFVDPVTGRFLPPEEVDTHTEPAVPHAKATGEKVLVRYEKMSKSKRNGVDPAVCVDRHGADALRAHILFAAPVADVLEWDEAKIVGVSRWLRRVWRLTIDASDRLAAASPGDRATFAPSELDRQPTICATLYAELGATAASVNRALSKTYALNTCISDLMSLANALAGPAITDWPPAFLAFAMSHLIRMLAPFAPALAEECWEILHARTGRDLVAARVIEIAPTGRDSVFGYAFPAAGDFPEIERAKAVADGEKKVCVVMENGRKRLVLEIRALGDRERSMSPTEVEQWVLGEIQSTNEGREWLRRKKTQGGWKWVVVVNAGKTVNFVG